MTKPNGFYKVAIWNAIQQRDGKHMLIYTLGNGSMIDEPRRRGYVVQKYHVNGGEKSKFYLKYADAIKDFETAWN